MSENSINDNLSYLGDTFQIKVLRDLIYDREFADEYISSLHPRHFTREETKKLFVLIKNYWDNYKVSPNPDNLKQILNTTNNYDEIDKPVLTKAIEKLQNYHKKQLDGEINPDNKFIRKEIDKFVRTQEYLDFLTKGKEYINDGDLKGFERLQEEKITKIKTLGNKGNEPFDVSNDVGEIIKETTRHPIPFGDPVFDKLIGGIGKGEFGCIFAGQGKGKTPFLTISSERFVQQGYNVFHVFIEDSKSEIEKKFLSQRLGISLNKFKKQNENFIKKRNEQYKYSDEYEKRGHLRLCRGYSGMPVSQMESLMVKDENALGIKFDFIVIDYIDKDTIGGESPNTVGFDVEDDAVKYLEGLVVRKDMRGLFGVQAKKESNNKEKLTEDDVYGRAIKLKKPQLVLSMGCSKEQQTKNLRNISILKCRFSRGAGMEFEGVTFDTSKHFIDFTESEYDSTVFLLDDDEDEIPVKTVDLYKNSFAYKIQYDKEYQEKINSFIDNNISHKEKSDFSILENNFENDINEKENFEDSTSQENHNLNFSNNSKENIKFDKSEKISEETYKNLESSYNSNNGNSGETDEDIYDYDSYISNLNI